MKKSKEKEIEIPINKPDYSKMSYETLKKIESELTTQRLILLNMLNVLRFFQFTYLAIVTAGLIGLIVLLLR